MLLCLNADGTIVQKVAEPIYQGSNNASTIYVVAPITPDSGAQLSFILPNGKKTKPYTVFPTSFSPYQNDEKVVYCWAWLIPEAITAYAGTVKGQISFLTEKSVPSASTTYWQTISSAEFEFEVEQGVAPAFPDETASAYHEQFITALHNFLQTISNDFEVIEGDITQLQEDLPLIVDEVLRLNDSEIEDGYTNSIDEGSLNKTPSIGESALVLVQTKQSGNIYTAKMTITAGITTDEKGNNFYPFELSEVYLLHNGTTDSDVETILGGLTAQAYVNRINKIENDIPLIPNSPIIIGDTNSEFVTAVSSNDGYTGTIRNTNLNITPTVGDHLNLIIKTGDNYIYECSANISEIVSSTRFHFLIKGATKIVLLNNNEKVVQLEEEIPLVYNGVISLAYIPKDGDIVRLSVTNFNKSPVPGERFWALSIRVSASTVYSVKYSVISNNGSILEAEITEVIQLHNGNTDKLVRTAWQSNLNSSEIYTGDLDYLYSPGSYYIYNNAESPVDANGNKVDGLLQVIYGPVDSQPGMQILFGNNSKIYMRMLNEDMIWTQWQNVGLDTTKKFLSLVPLASLPDITNQQTLDELDKSAIYIIPNKNDNTTDDDNNYTEYVLVNIGTEQSPNWKWEVFGTLTSGVSLENYATKDFVNEKISELTKYTDDLVNSSHVVNITALSNMYDGESDLENNAPRSNGARYIVKSLTDDGYGLPLFYYSYNASEGKWEKGYQIKGSTLYLNLADACLYRFTQNSNTDTYPYFIKITYTKAETEAMVENTIPLLFNTVLGMSYTYDIVVNNPSTVFAFTYPYQFNKLPNVGNVFYALSQTTDKYVLFMSWEITGAYNENTIFNAIPKGTPVLIHNGNTDNKVNNLDSEVWKNSPVETEYTTNLSKGTYYVKKNASGSNVPATGVLQVLYGNYSYIHVLFATDGTIYMRSGPQTAMSEWKDLSRGYPSIVDNRDESDPNNSSVSFWFTGDHDTEMRKAFLLNSLLLGSTHYGDGFMQDKNGNRLLMPELKQYETSATLSDIENTKKNFGLVFERFDVASGVSHVIKANGLYMVFSRDGLDLTLYKHDGSVAMQGETPIQNFSQLILMTSPYGDNHTADPDVFIAMGIGVKNANIIAGSLGVTGIEVKIDRGSYIKANGRGFGVMQMIRP